MHEGGRTLSTADKKVDSGNISRCCSGKRKTHRGYEFRRVTTEKRKDFDEAGKRTVPHNSPLQKHKKKKAGLETLAKYLVNYILIIKIIK